MFIPSTITTWDLSLLLTSLERGSSTSTGCGTFACRSIRKGVYTSPGLTKEDLIQYDLLTKSAIMPPWYELYELSVASHPQTLHHSNDDVSKLETLRMDSMMERWSTFIVEERSNTNIFLSGSCPSQRCIWVRRNINQHEELLPAHGHEWLVYQYNGLQAMLLSEEKVADEEKDQKEPLYEVDMRSMIVKKVKIVVPPPPLVPHPPTAVATPAASQDKENQLPPCSTKKQSSTVLENQVQVHGDRDEVMDTLPPQEQDPKVMVLTRSALAAFAHQLGILAMKVTTTTNGTGTSAILSTTIRPHLSLDSSLVQLGSGVFACRRIWTGIYHFGPPSADDGSNGTPIGATTKADALDVLQNSGHTNDALLPPWSDLLLGKKGATKFRASRRLSQIDHSRREMHRSGDDGHKRDIEAVTYTSPLLGSKNNKEKKAQVASMKHRWKTFLKAERAKSNFSLPRHPPDVTIQVHRMIECGDELLRAHGNEWLSRAYHSLLPLVLEARRSVASSVDDASIDEEQLEQEIYFVMDMAKLQAAPLMVASNPHLAIPGMVLVNLQTLSQWVEMIGLLALALATDQTEVATDMLLDTNLESCIGKTESGGFCAACDIEKGFYATPGVTAVDFLHHNISTHCVLLPPWTAMLFGTTDKIHQMSLGFNPSMRRVEAMKQIWLQFHSEERVRANFSVVGCTNQVILNVRRDIERGEGIYRAYGNEWLCTVYQRFKEVVYHTLQQVGPMMADQQQFYVDMSVLAIYPAMPGVDPSLLIAQKEHIACVNFATLSEWAELIGMLVLQFYKRGSVQLDLAWELAVERTKEMAMTMAPNNNLY